MTALVAGALGVFVVLAVETFLEHMVGWPPIGAFALVYWSICVLLFARGLWLVTTPNELIAQIPGGEAWRRIVRDCVAGIIVTVAATLIAAALRHAQAVSWIVGLGMPFGVGGVLMLVSITKYMERIARFVGDEFVARRSRLYRRGLMACVTVGLFSMGMGFMSPGFACPLVLAAPVYLGFAILTCTLPAVFTMWFDDEPAAGAPPDAGDNG